MKQGGSAIFFFFLEESKAWGPPKSRAMVLFAPSACVRAGGRAHCKHGNPCVGLGWAGTKQAALTHTLPRFFYLPLTLKSMSTLKAFTRPGSWALLGLITS